jgi:ubiquinone/menaquinone biosynthesis C-methylase UbiE
MSNRKLLLAQIRNGNYAHAGEEEAIDLSLELIKKNPNQKLLDIGCGLGGTADYIEKRGFGKVTGIDLDPVVLKKAKEIYPNIPFHLCDANTVDTFFKNQKFNILYSFNAFFCFKNQENCLRAFAKVAEENAELLIFDYSSPGFFSKVNPFGGHTGSTVAESFSPINLAAINELLLKTHWKLKKIINLNDKYRYWYQTLISKMENQKDDLTQRFGQTTFDEMYFGYTRLLDLIERGEIGGCIIHATLHK